jgi:flagellin
MASINTNISALNAYRNYNSTQGDLAKSTQRLSSGYRINSAADDAAGLAISEGLRAQISGSEVALRNANDGISLAQTAEGALAEVHTILGRIRDLAVQSANDTNNTQSRAAIDTEKTALVDELTRLSTSTNFNGIKLLDGSADLTLQVGTDGEASSQISLDLTTVNLGSIATAVQAFDLTTLTGAQDALAATGGIDDQITAVSTARATIGATQNRLESVSRSLAISIENLSASESRIRDTDVPSEIVKNTNANIASQAGLSMLAQANQSAQNVLQLLR